MFPTRVLLQHSPRQPMIKFLGKRKTPTKVDHAPHVHPASSANQLPESFASYRQKAQQHGPLGGGQPSSQLSSPLSSSPLPLPPAGHRERSGASLGSVEAGQGEVFDRSELPARFQRKPWTKEEIDAIDSGGASMF